MTEQAHLTHLEEQWQSESQLDSNMCESAAGKGWLAVLQWDRRQGAPWDRHSCSAAACGEHMAVLEWALRQGCPWPWGTKGNDIWCAAYTSRHAFLTWARQQGMSDNMERLTCVHATDAGQVATLQWMRKHGWNWDWRVCAYAAGGGQLAVLQWAASTGVPGVQRLAQRQPRGPTGQSCSGLMKMAAHGTKTQPRRPW